MAARVGTGVGKGRIPRCCEYRGIQRSRFETRGRSHRSPIIIPHTGPVAIAWRFGPPTAKQALLCKSLHLIYRSASDSAIHLTASIIGEAGPILSRTRAKLASL